MSYSKKLVIVGCGSAKADEPRAAADLYTSNYFAKKREYAETVGDSWLILSAEHGLVAPGRRLDPYETSIDDLDEDALDELAHEIGVSLIDWIANELAKGFETEEIVVLAGRNYLDPLRERDAFSAGISPIVTYPLQANDLGGIGEQMGWLSERVDAESTEQTRLITDGGSDVSENGESRPEGGVIRRLKPTLTNSADRRKQRQNGRRRPVSHASLVPRCVVFRGRQETRTVGTLSGGFHVDPRRARSVLRVFHHNQDRGPSRGIAPVELRSLPFGIRSIRLLLSRQPSAVKVIRGGSDV